MNPTFRPVDDELDMHRHNAGELHFRDAINTVDNSLCAIVGFR